MRSSARLGHVFKVRSFRPKIAAVIRAGYDNARSNINIGLSGEEVFEEKKSLLFKDLRVYRIYDTTTNTIVYVSYNTRFDKNDDTNKSRFKSSLCAINLNDPIIASTSTPTESSVAVAETK